MKKIIVTILSLVLCSIVFSQTTNNKRRLETSSDTSKTTTTTTTTFKKKLVMVPATRVNAVSSATIKIDKAKSNNNGTKEEDTQPK